MVSRGFVGEEADDAGSALDLRVERLAHVGGAQALAARLGEGESGESFRDVLLGPGGEFRRALGVAANASACCTTVLIAAS